MTRTPLPWPSWRPPLLLSLVVLAWSFLLLGNFDLRLEAAEKLDGVFPDMAARLLRGDATIDPAAIQWEAFVHDGRTTTYFGVFGALLRMPLVLAGIPAAHLARVSCLGALWLLGLCNARLVQLALERWRERSDRGAVAVAAYLGALGAGPAIYTLASASIYHETLWWGAAFLAWFNLVAAGPGLMGRPVEGRTILLLAVIAGLGLMARSSVGVALYAGLVLVGLAYLWRWPAEWPRMPLGAFSFVAAILVAVAFLAVQLAVNQARWGNPFVTFPLAEYGLMQAKFGSEPALLQRMLSLGVINPVRLPQSFAYYFGAIDLPQVLGVERLDAGNEGPRMLPWLSAPLPVLAGLAGIAAQLRHPWRDKAATAVLATNAASLLLVLSFAFIAMRYLMDGWGLFAVGSALAWTFGAERLRPISRRSRAMLVGLAVASVVLSHATLLRYKLVYSGTMPEARYVLSRAIQPLLCPSEPLLPDVRLSDFNPLVTVRCPPLW